MITMQFPAACVLLCFAILFLTFGLNNAQTNCSLFLNNKCFVFVNTLYTFDNAEANCVSLGGHLTSVHSAAENTGIRNLYTSGNAWIGMLEDAANNQQWVDGTAVSYTSWATGQPNNANEDCGAFWSSNSLWWDRPCSDTYYSICLIPGPVQGDVRLDGSNETHTGILQVYYNSIWGYVCDDAWGTNDARVVCRQLGFDGVSSTQGSIYAPSAFYWLDDVGCTGNEENISICYHLAWGSHNCGTNEHVNVTCSYGYQGELRLVDYNDSYGVLQIFNNEVWGDVCDDLWDINDANVACRDLGFSGASSFSTSVYRYPSNFQLDNVECTGREDNLTSCQANPLGNHNCGSYEHVILSCFNSTYFNQSCDIILDGDCFIFVESLYNWADAEANCVSLGGHLTSINSSYQNTGIRKLYSTTLWIGLRDDGVTTNWSDSTPISYLNWQSGQPNNLAHHCVAFFGSSSAWWDRPCSDLSRSVCRITELNDGDVRLIDGTYSTGIAQVYHNDRWGNICDDFWDLTDANVLCRQLGFSAALAYTTYSYQVNTYFWLDDVRCVGTESKIGDCPRNAWGSHNCASYENAGVICAYVDTNLEGEIRLVDGTNTSGILQINHHGSWGDVCDDYFATTEATVVCAQLGFVGLDSFQTGVYRSTTNFWLDNLFCFGTETSLSNCYHNGWGSHNCASSEHVRVTCIGLQSGDVRIIDGTNSSGTVEVYHNSRWGGICDDFWGRPDATVVCRQLGFYGVSSYTRLISSSDSFYWLDNVHCTGLEERISDCNSNAWGSHDCSSSEHAGVVCIEGVEGALRMISGTNSSGILQIYYNGDWGFICDDGWNFIATTVACRQLAFVGAISYTTAVYYTPTNFILDDVSCNGSEGFIYNCSNSGWNQHNCYSFEHIRITCQLPNEGDVRIIGGNYDLSSGVVQVYHNAVWGGICDDQWGINDANVICRQLGYSRGALSYSRNNYIPNNNYFWLDNVQCNGDELNISSCANLGWGVHNCGSREHAGVACIAEDVGSVRLVDGTNSSGIVQVYYAGLWGYICDDFFDFLDANVICKQLGFEGASTFRGSVYLSNAFYWLDDVECDGSEAEVGNCTHTSWGSHNCGYFEHVQITCLQGLEGKVRLVDGTSSSGIVQVYHAGSWGYVCDDNWDIIDAKIVCKQLGFHSAINATQLNYVASTNYWLDNVNCVGSEEELVRCPHTNWGIHNCGSYEHAGVYCAEAINGDVRLVNGSVSSGIVEVHYNGQWGSICDDLWGISDADVVCRQLGYPLARRSLTNLYKNDVNFLLDDVQCSGNENNIADCAHNSWGSHNCGSSEHAGAVCETERDRQKCDVIVDGVCFIIETVPMNWTQAEENCMTLGAHLATIQSVAENTAIRNYFANAPIWLGYNDMDSDSQFSWVDNSTSTYTNWAQGQPNRGTQDCTTFFKDTNSDWYDRPCSESYSSVCRIEAEDNAICQACDTKIGDDCFVISQTRMSWIDAENSCKAWGGHLASINSFIEQIYITSMIYNVNYFYDYIWIGLNDQSSEGVYQWVDESNSTYRNWALLPTSDPSLDCIFMNYYGTNIWNHTSCQAKFPFICKFPAGTNAPTELAQSDINEHYILLSWNSPSNIDYVDHYILSYEYRGATMEIEIGGCLTSYKLKHPEDDYTLTLSACTANCCNYNGTYLTVNAPIKQCQLSECQLELNGDCFRYFPTASNWSVAERTCVEWGGHLTSIRSDLEQAAIISLTRIYNRYAWIGLNDLSIDGIFEWSDGSLDTYREWYPSYATNGDCVIIVTQFYGFYWYSFPCVYTYNFVCRKPEPVQTNGARNLTLLSVFGSQLSVSWEAAPIDNLEYYLLGYRVGEYKNYIKLSSCVTSHTLLQLTELSNYTISLLACNSSCCSKDVQYLQVSTNNQSTLSAPENVQAAALSSSSVRVTWDATCGSQLSSISNSYDVSYQILGDDTSLNTVRVSGWNSSFSKDLTNLISNKAYLISVSAVGARQISTNNIVAVQTLVAVPTSQVQNLTLSKLTSTSALFTWLTPDYPLTTSVVTQYKVILYRGSALLSTQTVKLVQFVEISGLSPNTGYRLTVAAGHDQRFGPVLSYTFTTLERAPFMTAPQNLVVNALNSSSIQVNFDPPTNEANGGTISSYHITYTQLSAGETPVTVSVSNTNSYTLTGLQAYTAYSIKVSAENAGGESPSSVVEYVRTLEASPSSAVQNLIVLEIYPTRVDISWVAPISENWNGKVDRYKIVLSDSTTVLSSTLWAKLENLQANTQYSVSVYAGTSVGFGPEAQLQFTTSAFVASNHQPRNLSATVISASEIMVSWNNPEDQVANPAIMEYRLTYMKIGSAAFNTITIPIVASTSYSYTLNTLEAFSDYSIKVTSIDSTSDSLGTSSIYVTTLESSPSSAVRNLIILQTYSTRVDIAWLPPIRSDWNGIITHYRVTVLRLSESTAVIAKNVSTQWEKLENLEPSTTYTVTIEPSTSVGFGQPATLDITTLSSVTIPTQCIGSSLNIQKIGLIDDTYNFMVKWDNYNCKLSNYTIYVSENANEIKRVDVINSNTGLVGIPNDQSTTLTARTLSIRVCIERTTECTEYSTLQLTAQELTPTIIQNNNSSFIGIDLTVKKLGIIDDAYSFMVSWNDQNSKTTSYTITISEGGIVLQSLAVVNSNVELVSIPSQSSTSGSVTLTIITCITGTLDCSNYLSLNITQQDLTSKAAVAQQGQITTVAPSIDSLQTTSLLGNSISVGELAIFAVIGMFIITAIIVVCLLVGCLVYRLKVKKTPRLLPQQAYPAMSINPVAFGALPEEAIYSDPRSSRLLQEVPSIVGGINNPFYLNPAFIDEKMMQSTKLTLSEDFSKDIKDADPDINVENPYTTAAELDPKARLSDC